jgi:hypothetical protein
VSGPQVVFARLIVLASVPFVEGRGAHILTFMQHFAANINKHLVSNLLANKSGKFKLELL